MLTFFCLNKEAKPLHSIFLHRQFSVSISIKKWVVYIKRVMKPYLYWDYAYAGKNFNERGGLIAMQLYICASDHYSVPPVSADGSPLFSFIQPTTASRTLSDSTLPCPSLSPTESQRKEKLPWTCPSSGAVEYLPFLSGFVTKNMYFFILSLSVAMSMWQPMSLLFRPIFFILTLQSTLWQVHCILVVVWKKINVNTLKGFFQTCLWQKNQPEGKMPWLGLPRWFTACLHHCSVTSSPPYHPPHVQDSPNREQLELASWFWMMWSLRSISFDLSMWGSKMKFQLVGSFLCSGHALKSTQIWES